MTLDALRAFGANVDEGMERCLHNEAFYLRLVKTSVSDPAFDALGAALRENDLGKAFDEAHKLKGMLANLSLTPILEPISKLTELLRNQTKGDYEKLYKTVLAKQAELKKVICE